MSRGKAIAYLYLPYLAIVVVVLLGASLLNYFLLSRLMLLPTPNCILIGCILLLLALLTVYRPVVIRITNRWSSRGQGFPADIVLMLPAMCILQEYVCSIVGLELHTEERFLFGASFGPRAFATTFIVGQLIWFLCIAFSRATKSIATTYATLSEEQIAYKIRKDFRKTFKSLTPTKNYLLVPILSLVFCGIYLMMLLSGVGTSPAEFFKWGTVFVPLMHSQFDDWRLITAGFIHPHIVSLATCVTLLIYSGANLEKVLGTIPTGIILLTSLIVGNVSAYLLGTHLSIAGSHYALMGVVGVMFFYSLFEIGVEDNRGLFIMNIVIMAPLLVLIDYIGEVTNGVNWAGLAGGFIGGIVAAIYYIPAMRRAKEVEL